MATADQNRIDACLARLANQEERVRRLFIEALVSGTPLYVAHLVLAGAGHRTISQCRGFAAMISCRNYACSASILRMQLDTALRLWGGFMHGNIARYADRIYAGELVRTISSSAGAKLTDRVLVNDLATQHPWVGKVYAATSGSVHFSRRHILAALEIKDEESGEIEIRMGPEDKLISDRIFAETCEAYVAVTELVLDVIRLWFDNIGNGADQRF